MYYLIYLHTAAVGAASVCVYQSYAELGVREDRLLPGTCYSGIVFIFFFGYICVCVCIFVVFSELKMVLSRTKRTFICYINISNKFDSRSKLSTVFDHAVRR